MFFLLKMSIEPFTKTIFWRLVVFPYFDNKKISEILASFGNNSYICRKYINIV